MTDTLARLHVDAPSLAPAYGTVPAIAPGPQLTIVIPTRNERDNVRPVYEALCRVLDGIDWEAIFVDDDSTDGTPDAVTRLAGRDRRVRLLHRIGRRGLASACVEGIQASTAPIVAVMDADMQHDETLLPEMLHTLMTEPIDAVVGSRYADNGSIGDWSPDRARLSDVATRIGRVMLGVPLSDPMSGFFMLRRDAFQGSVRNLSSIGFKILLDILASAPRPLRVKEIPFHFRSRHAGTSKFDALIGWEYLMLLADKLVGHLVPVRFVLFALVGGLGILGHVAVLWFCLNVLQTSFAVGQSAATALAIIGNFTLNNWLTYRDRRLAGWGFARGLASFALICSFGAMANIGIATVLFDQQRSFWWVAGIAGAAMSLVWNYAVSASLTWRSR